MLQVKRDTEGDADTGSVKTVTGPPLSSSGEPSTDNVETAKSRVSTAGAVRTTNGQRTSGEETKAAKVFFLQINKN
jgi:hypothetical protein